MKTIAKILMGLAIMGTAASCSNTNGETAQDPKQIGLQLYSARTLLGEGAKYHDNFPALLDTLAKMGYTHFEAASYDNANHKFYGYSPEELKQVADSAGVKIFSSHTGRFLNEDELKSGDLADFSAWWDTTIADHKAAGFDYIVMPWMGVPKTLDDLKKQCEALNMIGAKAKEQGLKFGYHNHSHEFQKVEDQTMLDYMIENTDPENVFFEMDVFWTMMGKSSPVDYFNKYPGRFTLLHIKDLREIGQSGMVGFDAIFNNIDKAGMVDYVVELEKATGDIEQGLAESAEYLQEAPFVKASYAKE